MNFPFHAAKSAFLCWLGGARWPLRWLLAYGNLRVEFSAGRVLIRRGTLFPVHIACPARSILAVSAFSTPLLRRLGCPVVLLTLSGRTVLLPAVPAAGYRALCALSGR